MTPEESSLAQAGEWRITLPRDAMDGLSDVLLAIRYQGDEARLLNGNRLLTDNFFNGSNGRSASSGFSLPAQTSRFRFCRSSKKRPSS